LRLTTPHSNIAIARLLALAVVSLGLALAAACGSSSTSSSSSSSTPASAVSRGASASPGSGSSTPQASGAVSGTPPGPTAVACTSAAPDAGLISQVSFGLGKSVYTVGQAIDITLLLANCGNNDAVLHFPTTQRYDFIITDPNGVEDWRSSDGKSFGQVEGTETLQPGQTATYTETWNQKDRTGTQVPAGQYKVSAFSVGCGVAARAGCQFGPIQYVQIQAAPGT
jgi:Intracellular proteinase inhibitor